MEVYFSFQIRVIRASLDPLLVVEMTLFSTPSIIPCHFVIPLYVFIDNKSFFWYLKAL